MPVSSYLQEKSYAEQLVNYAVGVVEKYNGRRGNAVNFGSGTGISSFLLSKNFENVTNVDCIQYYIKLFVTVLLSIRLLVLSTVVGSQTLHSRSKRGGVWSTLVRVEPGVRPSCPRELSQIKSSSNKYKLKFSKMVVLIIIIFFCSQKYFADDLGTK